MSFLVAFGFLIARLIRGWNKPEEAKGEEADAMDRRFRHKVTMFILNSVIGGLIVLSLIIVIQADFKDSKDIFNILLPVFAAWVGMLLTFYFSKENFEAAQKTVAQLAEKITGEQKLQSTRVDAVMKKPHQFWTLPDNYIGKEVGDPKNEIKLSELLKHLASPSDKDRLPLFKDSQGLYAKIDPAAGVKVVPAGVVHASTIRAFRDKKVTETPTTNIADLSLKDLINDTTFKSVFDNSFGVVAQDATLARAKAIMDNLSDKMDKKLKAGCYDIFVTQTGDDKGSVIGWITNDIINDNAKV